MKIFLKLQQKGDPSRPEVPRFVPSQTFTLHSLQILDSRPVSQKYFKSRPVPSRNFSSRPVPKIFVPSRPVPKFFVPSRPIQKYFVPSRPVPKIFVPSRPVPSQNFGVPSRPVPFRDGTGRGTGRDLTLLLPNFASSRRQ
jgi:hypothetical protein